MRQSIRALRTGAAAAVLQALRDSATKEAPGFDEAWAKVVLIPGWLPEPAAGVIWGVISDLQPICIVEIGTYLARSAALMAMAVQCCGSGGKVVTVDPHTGGCRLQGQIGAEQPTTELLARAHLEGHRLIPDRVDMRIARSMDEAQRWEDPIDFVYVDGWHTYEAARADALAWGTHLTSRGIIAFDDVGLIADVERGARDAVRDLDLHWYGTILGQGWAGKTAEPPASLARALKYRRFRTG